MNTKRNTCRHAASFLLALLLSLTLSVPALAAEKEVELSTADELIAFAESGVHPYFPRHI